MARVAGPLLVTEIYAAGGSYWMLGSVTSTLVLALALTIIFYRTLVPPTSKAELTQHKPSNKQLKILRNYKQDSD